MSEASPWWEEEEEEGKRLRRSWSRSIASTPACVKERLDMSCLFDHERTNESM